MTTPPTIGVIGGSGLYELAGLTEIEEHRIDTPFGPPSDSITAGRLGEIRLLFLARHGKGHRLLPSEVNYRANIFALKLLGAERLVSISAAGSMREEIKPGDLVVVDQYIDRTKARAQTFFGGGIAGHVMFADPVCPVLSEAVFRAATSLPVTVHQGGTLLVMEGPAFSTRAEAKMHRQLDVDLIGMTAMPEAKLAREAELCYATLALATDYDCWHETAEDVTVEAVIEILRQNVDNAKEVIRNLASQLTPERSCPCPRALDHAVITKRDKIPAEVRERLAPLLGRVL